MTREPTSRAADRAAEWLRVVLERGPMPASLIRAHAEARRLAWRTVQRAASAAGVVVERKGFSGGSTWRLPFAPEPETRKNPKRSAGCRDCGHLAAAGACLAGVAVGLHPDALGRFWPSREQFDNGCGAFAPSAWS